MSVNLTCPNCDRVIGEASHEDNYIEKYYYHDEDGEPMCPTCDVVPVSWKEFFVIVGVLLGIGLVALLW